MRLRLLFCSPTLLPRLLRDGCGAIAIIVALILPLVIGFLALGVEAGLWYAEKTQYQSAVDSAAITAAIARAQGDSTIKDLAQLASYDANSNGANSTAVTGTCPPASGTNWICVNNPPLNGPLAGVANAVEVYLSQDRQTTFTAAFAALQGFSKSNVTIMNRAVAVFQPVTTNGACWYSTFTTESVEFDGGVVLDLHDCGLVVDGIDKQGDSIKISGSKNLITAGSVVVAGNISPNPPPPTELIAPFILTNVSPSLLPPTPYASLVDPFTAAGAWPLAAKIAGATTAASKTLTFASAVPATIFPGMLVTDSKGAIPAGTLVVSRSGATVTIDQAATATYPAGDNITFGPQPDPQINSGSKTLKPGFYSSISVTGSGTLYLTPGTYYLDLPSPKCPVASFGNGDSFCVNTSGNISLPPGTTSGTVILAFDGGNVNIQGGNFEFTSATPPSPANIVMALTFVTKPKNGAGTFSITGGTGGIEAPSTDSFAAGSHGILIYQDPLNQPTNPPPNNYSPPGNPCFVVTGSLDTPGSPDNFNGNTQTGSCSSCTQLIAYSFKMNGATGYFSTAGCAGAGVNTNPAKGIVLAE